MKYDVMYTANKIRELREENNLTREELSQKVFISLDHLRSIERGRRKPTLDILVHLGFILNVSVDYLLYEQSDKNREIRELIEKCKTNLNEIEKKI